MSLPALRRLTAVLGTLCTALLVGGVFLLWSHGALQLEAAFAEEQTRIFDEMRRRALQSTSPSDVAGALEYPLSYYPSGSKQRAGSRLDRVVERHRATVVHDIVAHLRRITGQDLG